MSKKVYISGKITGLELKRAETNFEAVSAFIRMYGDEPVNPMKILPYAPDLKWEDYLKADIKALCDCHCIVMMPNWKDSKWAIFEHDIAQRLGLEIQYLK